MGLLQEKKGKQGDKGQPPPDGIQTDGKGEADVGKRNGAQIQTADRARGCIRTDEIQHAIQTLLSFW